MEFERKMMKFDISIEAAPLGPFTTLLSLHRSDTRNLHEQSKQLLTQEAQSTIMQWKAHRLQFLETYLPTTDLKIRAHRILNEVS